MASTFINPKYNLSFTSRCFAREKKNKGTINVKKSISSFENKKQNKKYNVISMKKKLSKKRYAIIA